MLFGTLSNKSKTTSPKIVTGHLLWPMDTAVVVVVVRRKPSRSASLPQTLRFVGLVVKESASRAKAPEFNSRLRSRDFTGSSYTNDLKVGTPVATLPGDWRYRVSGPVSVYCDWVR